MNKRDCFYGVLTSTELERIKAIGDDLWSAFWSRIVETQTTTLVYSVDRSKVFVTATPGETKVLIEVAEKLGIPFDLYTYAQMRALLLTPEWSTDDNE